MCKPTDRRSGCHGPRYSFPEVLRSILIHPQPKEWTSDLIIPQQRRATDGSWTQGRAYRVVRHDYHDHLKDRCDELDLPDPVSKGGVQNAFPVQLHEILDNIEEDGHADVISWQPHGRCFVVRKPQDFLHEIMPRYFKQKKFASFQRQLNLYGFQRLTIGRDKGAYYHELFLRDKPLLAHKIRRQRIKGTGVRPRSNPDAEPNFYAMPSVSMEDDDSDASTHVDAMKSISTDNDANTNVSVTKSISMDDDDDPIEVASSEDESISSLAPPIDMMDEELQRSPSPAVMDHRTPKEKLCSSFQPESTTSSDVVPYIETSCSKSELHRPEEVDDKDDVIVFEGKHFHYLNPFASFQPIVRSATPEVEDECQGLEKRMEAILEALTGPMSGANLDSMDELSFGNLLEDLVLQQN